MIAVIQRVKSSSVSVDGKVVNKIEKGLNVLIGFEKDDTLEKVEKMAKKIAKLKLFERFKKSVIDIEGEILLISNFTLPATTKKNKPNFQNSLEFEKAKELYEKLLEKLNDFIPTKGGVFGAMMEVEIVNDGPVTIILKE